MSLPVLFFDTNILMYAVGSEHPLRRPCRDLLEQVAMGEIQAVTDTEVFQEIAYRYWSQRRWSIAMQVLQDYEQLFSEIYPIEQRHLKPYYQLLHKYSRLSPRDAIHIAVMQEAKLANIITADKAFSKVAGLKVWAPKKVIKELLSH